MGNRVQSSQIDPNQTNEVQRRAIQLDQVQYESRKADPLEWLDVLRNLGVLRPMTYLNEKVICNYVLDQWWNVRFIPGRRPIYLQFAKVHYLSLGMTAHLLQTPTAVFEINGFQQLYQSVACREDDRRVCFFLSRTQSAMGGEQRDVMACCNHFFPVLFDYDAHKAHVFGTVSTGRPEVKAEGVEESKWHCWLGPELWKMVGMGMGWGETVGDPKTVRVVTKNWKQVRGPSCHR